MQAKGSEITTGPLGRRAVLRLLPAAALAGLGLLPACSGDGETDLSGDNSPVVLRIGGDRGQVRKAKFGSGRGRMR